MSLAVAKAGAAAKGVPLYRHIADLAGKKEVLLPVPAFNIINGGSHAGNKLAMQEFMILPVGASSFSEAMRMGVEVYHHLKAVIKDKYGQDATNVIWLFFLLHVLSFFFLLPLAQVGDEGGFAPNIQSNEEGLELCTLAIEKGTLTNTFINSFSCVLKTPILAGYTGKVKLGMDVAASEFFKHDKYDLDFKTKDNDGSQLKTSGQLQELYEHFTKHFPVVSIEDPFDQDDWEAYAKLTAAIGTDFQIVGDDLLVTNPKRIQKAIENKTCNALLLKV